VPSHCLAAMAIRLYAQRTFASARRHLSTRPINLALFDPQTLVQPVVARDDAWAFTPLCNVLAVTGNTSDCSRTPSFMGQGEKMYAIPHTASILDACKQMVQQDLSFLVVVRPTISAGNAVIGVATEHKWVRYGAEKIRDAGDDERSAFLSGWSLSDPVYKIMTPTDRMLSLSPFDTVLHCVSILEKKLFRHLPVVSPGNGDLRGILNVKELLRPNGQLWAPLRDLWSEVPVEKIVGLGGQDISPERYMVDSKSMLSDAVVHMAEFNLKFVLAVDRADGDRVKGVITERDYVIYGSKVEQRRRVGGHSMSQTIEELMTTAENMLAAREGDTGAQCLDEMLAASQRYMPVLNKEGTHVTGILTLGDLISPVFANKQYMPGQH